MGEPVIININGKYVRAYKFIYHIIGKDSPTKIIAEKIKYQIELDLELYKFIPLIVKIKGKEFYKSDIRNINQEYFSLIEI